MSALWGGVTPIGIDIGSKRVKLAQLARTRRGWRACALSAFDRLDRAPIPGEAELGRIAEVLDRAGFVGDEVVVGAPRACVHTAVLELPPRKSGAPLEQICQSEVSRMFRLAPGSYEMHAWEVPSASSRSTMTQMAASALSWSDAEALVAPFDRAGLSVVAIDLVGEATSRACAHVMQGLSELGVLIDLGEAGLDLLVFRAGACVYHRRLEALGLAWIAETVARKLAIPARGAGALIRRFGLAEETSPEADALCATRARVILREQVDLMLQETLSSVAYALDRFPGEAVSALRLVGGGANTPGIAPYLTEISGVEAAPVVPASLARGLSARRHAAGDPSYMTALGHALWGSD
ncbi:MAG TPA: pilus assembly protein PilM [Phycisphaerales bacterium]|nr:pilus assembly protein PilM [Phycisphaerales bacterium]